MRIAARIAVFALIGAAATVLVAWGAFWHWNGRFAKGYVHGEHSHKQHGWPWEVPNDWPTALITVWRTDRFGYQWEEASWFDFPLPKTTAEPYQREGAWCAVRTCVGWPRVTARAYQYGAIPKRHPLTVTPALTTAEGLTPVFGGMNVPSLIAWPGFLVDTAFWGGAAFLVWSAPGFVRRGVRRRRGRCVRCGYELAGVSVCPECGGAA